MDKTPCEQPLPRAASAPALVPAALRFVSILLVLSGLALGSVKVWRALAFGVVDVIGCLEAAVVFLTLAALGGMLRAAAWMIRRRCHTEDLCRKMIDLLEGGTGAGRLGRRDTDDTGDAPAVEEANRSELLRRVLTELVDMNSTLLMTPAQRRTKRDERQARAVETLAAEINHVLGEGDFVRTQRLLERLEEQVPGHPQQAELRKRLTETRAAAEKEEAERESRRAEDYIAVGSFDQARQVAEALCEKYPDSASALALLVKVRRETKTFGDDQRRRLYAEAQQQARERRWGRALGAVRRLIEAYPDSAEADAARAMMSTIETNARIEEGRRLRDEFSDMFRRNRYPEALAIATDIIQRFPETQAARDLRGQLDRLKELASQGGA